MLNRDHLIVLALASAVFLPLLGARDIVTSHEGRVAETARTMAESGWPWAARSVSAEVSRSSHAAGEPDRAVTEVVHVNPWVVPVLTGGVRLQKPPLPYWATATLYRLFGISETTARLAPALLGVVATLLVFELARMLRGRATGWCAALVWLSTLFVQSEFRYAMADPYLAFFALACVFSWIRATRPGATTPANRWVLLAYVSIGLALIAKGPVVFVHVGIALAAYHACYRRHVPGRWWMHVMGVVCALAIAVPWPLAVMRVVPGALEVWRFESIGEMLDNARNARPWWYYGPNLAQLALPWTPVWVLGLVYPFVTRRRRDFFPLAWLAATVLFFSFVHMKKSSYLLPAMPAQTLLIAQALVGLPRLLARARTEQLARIASGLQALVPIGFGLVVIVMLVQHARRDGMTPLIGAGMLLTAIATAAAIDALRRKPPATDGRAFVRQVACLCVVAFVFVNVMQAMRNNRRSPRPFAEGVVATMRSTGIPLNPSGASPHLAFYLPRPTADLPRERVLMIVEPKRNASINRVTAIPLAGVPKRDEWTLYDVQFATPTTATAGSPP